MSKGSKPRPYSVSDEVFSNNFDSILPRESAKQILDVFNKAQGMTWVTFKGYESCKESDTNRTDAAKNRALVNR